MKQTTSRPVQDGLKYIDAVYGFMLQRGYNVVTAEDIPMGWQVVLRKPDLVVRIQRTRGEEDISFRTAAQPPDEFFDIGSVVYAGTGAKIPLASYSGLSKELQKYIDRIETYFHGDPVLIQDSLIAAKKEYRATLIPVQPASPKKPAIIPVLHYPLMAVIMLLLFGALITLYMVLLNGMLSAFSLDADTYGIFIGIASLLFAVGTMYLFWLCRKKG